MAVITASCCSSFVRWGLYLKVEDFVQKYPIDDLVQDCSGSNSIVNALKLPQSCAKPSVGPSLMLCTFVIFALGPQDISGSKLQVNFNVKVHKPTVVYPVQKHWRYGSWP